MLHFHRRCDHLRFVREISHSFARLALSTLRLWSLNTTLTIPAEDVCALTYIIYCHGETNSRTVPIIDPFLS
jgi:hypothetical protein